MDESRSGGGGLVIVAIVIIFVLLVIALIGGCGGYVRTGSGEQGVVRNGGIFDNKKIRQTLPEASEREWIGWWSDLHKYPSTQRYYAISASAEESDTGNVDQVNVPSSDGVNLGIRGTLYFELTSNSNTLQEFDNEFGTRKFAGKYPHDGDKGFQAWLNTVVRPVIDQNFRKQFGNIRCEDVYPSCQLVQNQGKAAAVNPYQGKMNNEKIAQIETAISEGLDADIFDQLGKKYLVDIKFSLAKVEIPTELDKSITRTQAEFANVTRSRARLRQARIDAKANKAKQKGYAVCPACAQKDILASIPDTLQTFAPGSGFAITPGN